MAVTYTWKKYNCTRNQVFTGTHLQKASHASNHLSAGGYNSSSSSSFNSNFGSYSIYKTCSYDPTTRIVTFSGLLASSTSYNTVWQYLYNNNYSELYITERSSYTVSETELPPYEIATELDYFHFNGFRVIKGADENSSWENGLYVYHLNVTYTYEYGPYIQGSYISDVTSTSSSTYPQNGRHTDGYWYVYQGNGNVAPTTPGTPTFTSEIRMEDIIDISWSASSDADGNLSGYQLQVSLSGGSWTSIYTGSSTSVSYTVPSGTETIAFRVRAYDSLSAYSSYATSLTVVVYPKESTTVNGSSYANIDGAYKSLKLFGKYNLKYKWAKYYTNSSTSYVDTAGSEITYEGSTSTYVYSNDTYSFDASTGEYSLGDTTSIARGRVYNLSAGDYFIFDSVSSASTIYECVSNTVVNKQYVIIYKERTATTKTAYSRGSYIGEVTSTNSSAYPTNGRNSDGYWYVYSDVESIYDATIGSYVNIGGVWKSLIDGYENIDGIWTSLKPFLPNGYTQCEYIQFTGTQWIDTGLKLPSTFKIELGLTPMASKGIICGVQWSSPKFELCVWENNMGLCTADTQFTTTAITPGSGYYDLICENNVFTINGITETKTVTKSNSTAYNLLIGAHGSGEIADYHGQMKLYYFKLYSKGNIVRDFVPCINASGVAGMWDKVEGKFYGNNGTGSFTAGN